MKIFFLLLVIYSIKKIAPENNNVSKQRRAVQLTTKAQTTITPKPTNCSLPKLEIHNGIHNKDTPYILERPKDIFLAANVTINCIIYQSTKNKKMWSIYKINENTNQEENITLVNVTSIYNTELFIPKNTLDYGLYKFKFQVELRSNTSFTSSIDTWIRIIESKGIFWAFPNGADEISVGYSQKVIIDPLKYSYFLEPSKTFENYSFNYYCRVLKNDVAEEYPKDILNTLIDLRLFKASPTAFNVSSGELCFNDTSAYDYNESTKQLIIQNLTYVPFVSYQFLIIANISEIMYETLVEIKIHNVSSLSELTIGCKYKELCVKVNGYYVIDPLKKLKLIGHCFSQCENQSFSIYKRLNKDDLWLLVNNTLLSMKELNSSVHELTIYEDFFLGLNVNELKVEYKAYKEGYPNTANIFFRVNMLPFNGTCSVSPTSGLSLRTIFNITCINWIDSDGKINQYEYILSDGMNKITIGYQDSPSLITSLPQGPEFDSHELQIIVRIYDDFESYTQFTINDKVSVNSYFDQANYSTVDDLFTQNINILYEGNQHYSCNFIICYASLLNTLNYQNKTNLISSSQKISFVTLFGLEQNIPSNVTFDNITSINTTFLGFKKNNDMSEVNFEQDRNQRATIRDNIAYFLKNMTISDLRSVKQILSTIYLLSLRNDELTRNTATFIISHLSEIIAFFEKNMYLISFDHFYEISQMMLSILGNLQAALSNPVFRRLEFLNVDNKPLDSYEDFEYDTDPENFMSNPNNLVLDGDFSAENLNLQRNILLHIEKQVSISILLDMALDLVTKFIIEYLNDEKTIIRLRTNILTVTFHRHQSFNHSIESFDEALSRVKIPKFCEEMYKNCPVQDNIVISRVLSQAIGPSGLNGANESRNGFSQTIGLSFFDSTGRELEISNTSEEIHLWIARDPKYTQKMMNKINMSILYDLNYTSINFNQSLINSSIHLEIQPNSNLSSYLVLLNKISKGEKFDDNSEYYDFFKILCQNSTDKDKKLSLFISPKEIKFYIGIIKIRIRELNSNEKNLYCNSTTLPNAPKLFNQTVWTSEFSYLVYLSGCYYYDSATNRWLSNGMNIQEDTNLFYTHCTSNHLTVFAGGFYVPSLDNILDKYVFTRNLSVFITILCLIGGFCLLTLWSIYMDSEDLKKMGILCLDDNHFDDTYKYKITIFTGNQLEAGTNSHVIITINGDESETEKRLLNSSSISRKVFRREGIDCFLMTTHKSLGNLNYIRIWHDNSGKGDWASWFCNYIIIKDLQTGQKFYFFIKQWLAVEKDDGRLERVIPVAGEAQKSELKNLLAEEFKERIFDGHLWLSIFTRPTHSHFTRFERTTCCATFSFISMFLNSFYYALNLESTLGSFNLITLKITYEQILVGVFINLVLLVPLLLLIGIFRMIRLRKNQSIIEDFKNENYKIKRYKCCTCPWWFTVIPLLISYSLIGFSIYSIVLRVFDYTDQEVNNWLVSFIVCLLVSFILVNPLQILLKIMIKVIFTGRIQKQKSIDDFFDENAPIKSNDSLFTKSKHFNLDPLDSYKIEIAKEARLKSLKIKKMVKEGIVFIIFMTSLSFVSYTNDVNLAYQYKSSMVKLFSLDKNFSQIQKIDDFWIWINNDFFRSIRADKWYNKDQPIGLAGYLNDKNSRIVGYPLMRQLRVKSNSCSLQERLVKLINYCAGEYSPHLEDKENYSFNWKEVNSSAKYQRSLTSAYVAFNYRTAENLSGYPFDGDYNSYEGGGYVYEIRGSSNLIKNNLTILRKSGWIDRYTRGLFIEFSVFNPNINMLAVCTFLLEILPSGGVLTSSRIDPFVLFQRNDNSDTVTNVFSFILVAFTLLFILHEIVLLFKQRREYITFWNLIEWLIILSALIAINIYIYRLYESFKVLDFFRRTSGYGYYKLQYVAIWNEGLRYSLAFCICLTTLKLLKFLSFNKIIAFLSLTIKLSSEELVAFTFIFGILWLAFVQLMYVCFEDKVIDFSTLFKSMSSCFQIMLGIFDVNKLLASDQFMAPLIFIFYNVFIVFILLNIFVTIISETFTNIRINHKKNEYYIDIVKEIKENINYLLSPSDKNIEILKIDKKDYDQEEYMKYVNYVDYFPHKIDQLLDRVNKMFVAQQEFLSYLEKQKEEKRSRYI